MNLIGKSLILFGAILIVIGVLVIAMGRIPWIGKLPGDIMIKRSNFTFYFPITTCIIASIILSLILFLFSKK